MFKLLHLVQRLLWLLSVIHLSSWRDHTPDEESYRKCSLVCKLFDQRKRSWAPGAAGGRARCVASANN